MMRDTTGLIKFKRLKRRLGLRSYATAGLLELLWHVTAKNTPDGGIGRFENEDIAEMLDWDGDPALLIAALVEERWLDQDPDHRLIVHDWSTHADDGVHMALARSVSLFADGTVPKFTRFAENERAKLKSRFSERYGADVIAAGKRERTQVQSNRAHGKRKKAHDQRTESTLPGKDQVSTGKVPGKSPGKDQEIAGKTREREEPHGPAAAIHSDEQLQGNGGVSASLSSGTGPEGETPPPSFLDAQRRLELAKKLEGRSGSGRIGETGLRVVPGDSK